MQNYANWASENLYQLIELRGYTNIKYIMLFTEPQRPSGKVPQGKMAYTIWRDCAVAVHNALLGTGGAIWFKLLARTRAAPEIR